MIVVLHHRWGDCRLRREAECRASTASAP